MTGYDRTDDILRNLMGGASAVENYTDQRIVEALDGNDRWERAGEARVSSRLTGSDIPAELRAAVDVVEAQAVRASTYRDAGHTEHEADRRAEADRESLIREHLRRNGDMDAACVATARDLRTRPASAAHVHESRTRRTTVHESMTATRTGATTIFMKIIDEGQGSSGYYSAAVLAQAARDKVFPKGTHVRVDHETLTEMGERPEGTLDRLAGYLNEDAYYKDGALYASATINSRWRYLVDDMADVIGVSISASADRDADGNIVRLVPSPTNRCDLVTIAGRGGAIV